MSKEIPGRMGISYKAVEIIRAKTVSRRPADALTLLEWEVLQPARPWVSTEEIAARLGRRLEEIEVARASAERKERAQRGWAPTPARPRIADLAAQGRSAEQVAAELGQPVERVEFVLKLKRMSPDGGEEGEIR